MPLETIWIRSDVCTVSKTRVGSIFAALEAYYNIVTRISGRSVDKQPSSAEKFPYTGLFLLNNIIDGQMAKKKVHPCPQSATYTVLHPRCWTCVIVNLSPASPLRIEVCPVGNQQFKNQHKNGYVRLFLWTTISCAMIQGVKLLSTRWIFFNMTPLGAIWW